MALQDIKKRAKEEQFTDELAEAIVSSNCIDIFKIALKRHDCPPVLLVDLSQSPDEAIRALVASHPNTPAMTIKRMANDRSPAVSRAAKARLK